MMSLTSLGVSLCGWLYGVSSVTAAELFTADGIAPSDVLLVDVRSDDEQRVSRIPGAIASDAFVEQLAESTNNNNRFQDRRIVVYCTVGVRSLQFCLAHRQQCIQSQLVNLTDGIIGYCNMTSHPALATPAGTPTRSVHVFAPMWNGVDPTAGYTTIAERPRPVAIAATE